MKDTKTAEVPIVVLDETTIQAIIDNIAAMAQMKPTDGALAMPRGRGSGRRPRGLEDAKLDPDCVLLNNLPSESEDDEQLQHPAVKKAVKRIWRKGMAVVARERGRDRARSASPDAALPSTCSSTM